MHYTHDRKVLVTMVFFELLEFAFAILLFTLIVFQVIIPLWNGTVLFPSFRFRSRQLDKQLRQARYEHELSLEERELEVLNRKAVKPQNNELKSRGDSDDDADVAP